MCSNVNLKEGTFTQEHTKLPIIGNRCSGENTRGATRLKDHRAVRPGGLNCHKDKSKRGIQTSDWELTEQPIAVLSSLAMKLRKQ